MIKYLTPQGPDPVITYTDMVSHSVVKDPINKYPTDIISFTHITEKRIPYEYGISGWFRFN